MKLRRPRVRPRTTLRVLVCTAHPDDEILIAGTLRRLCLGGAEVTMICATMGEQGPIRDSTVATRATVGDVRAREVAASGRVIGLTRTVVLDFPDGHVRDHADRLRQELTKAMRDLNPHLVITFGSDGITGHEDHIAVSQTATEAALVALSHEAHLCHFGLPRSLAQRLVLDFLLPAHQAAEIGVSTVEGLEVVDEATRAERISHIGSPPGVLDMYVDVRDLLDTKAEVFRCHASQPGSDRTATPLFEELFGEEFLRAVLPLGVTPECLKSFTTSAVEPASAGS